jgi:hypothetical protein
VPALSCIKSICDPSLDADLLISPLELICDLAGVPISSAEVSSALQAATTTATMTRYVTDTVTESYYWESSFAAVATSIVVPVIDSNGHIVIVAFPVTIEPSTTLYGSPSTSTPDVEATSSPASGYDFGSCTNPGIVYGYGLDGQSQFAFTPADQEQFPYGASPDIASVESFICKRLQDTCHATPEAEKACNEAFDAYSGLAGQNAADVWNIALGLPNIGEALTTTTTTVTWTELSTSGPTSIKTATTTTQVLGLGYVGTVTATVTSTVGGSGNGNEDGGGSPFSLARRERPRVPSLAIVVPLAIFVLCS